jgi:hypothetical protein
VRQLWLICCSLAFYPCAIPYRAGRGAFFPLQTLAFILPVMTQGLPLVCGWLL